MSHHIVVVQRYFFSLPAGRTFDAESEMQVPGTVKEIVLRFCEAQRESARADRLQHR